MSIEREEHCYMCNKLVRKYKLRAGKQPSGDMRTRDHIPPDNLFPDLFLVKHSEDAWSRTLSSEVLQ